MNRQVLLCAVGIACLSASAASGRLTPPQFDATKFTGRAVVTNQYFPLAPGTTFVYTGLFGGQPSLTHVYVSHETKVILGITCTVVKDSIWVNGTLEEATDDWYAQDVDGTVWYLGEYTTTFPTGSHEGSFQAGVKGAKAGIIMESEPEVGDTYRQEYFVGHAEDSATVISLTESKCVPYGCYSGNLLETNEHTPIDPGVVEAKYYAPGIGLVQDGSVKLVKYGKRQP